MLEVLAFVASGQGWGDNLLKAVMQLGGATYAVLGGFKFIGGMLAMDNRENEAGKSKMVWGGLTAAAAALIAVAGFNIGGMGFIK